MRFIGLFGFLFMAGIAQLSNAGFVFQIGNPSGANLSNLTQGQSYTSEVFVAGTAPDTLNSLTGVNFILNAAGGDTTMLSFSSTNVLLTPVGTPSPTTFTHAPAIAFAAPVANRVKIGDLSFVAGTLGTTTNFSFVDPNNAVGVQNMTAAFNGGGSTTIDAAVFSTPSIGFTVTAVPEPSSMALLGLVGGGFAAVRRFRKKKTA